MTETMEYKKMLLLSHLKPLYSPEQHLSRTFRCCVRVMKPLETSLVECESRPVSLRISIQWIMSCITLVLEINKAQDSSQTTDEKIESCQRIYNCRALPLCFNIVCVRAVLRDGHESESSGREYTILLGGGFSAERQFWPSFAFIAVLLKDLMAGCKITGRK